MVFFTFFISTKCQKWGISFKLIDHFNLSQPHFEYSIIICDLSLPYLAGWLYKIRNTGRFYASVCEVQLDFQKDLSLTHSIVQRRKQILTLEAGGIGQQLFGLGAEQVLEINGRIFMSWTLSPHECLVVIKKKEREKGKGLE